ncbi:hypothetical protein DPM19_24055 [Actinomadura craniellae]|uniref:Uncharacterized protein n=1 Tax=Actinomadura craniellae TaxID=2231787 RepID=A0A365H0S9_9ACTN|nr:hypothetical protein [Actinomadura craniellae]RAY12671.1 hypothetical protein DPM19_24055 [Actinomadura craniellae]
MSGPCDAAFRTMAERLGGISCDADPVGTVRAPWNLDNWTLPVVETLMIGGALFALVHAVRLWRRSGNPAALAFWGAAVAFVLILEPPLYFPRQFGIGEHLDVLFVHNVFGVQFLYDRMPLYIVALYPASFYLACSLVSALGVFQRHGRVLGAVCVGFVNHCFYEIFDHLGPQLRWWAWNTDAAVNGPMLGSVPLVSTVIFGIIAPGLLAFWWRLLIAEPAERGALGGGRTAAGTVAVAVLTTLSLPVLSAPVSYLTLAGNPNDTVMSVVLYAAVVVVGAVALPALARRADTAPAVTGDPSAHRYALLHGGVYLAVFAVLWAASLPDLLAAEHGVTGNGNPVGNPFYAAGCAVVCGWVLVLVRARAGRPVAPVAG